MLKLTAPVLDRKWDEKDIRSSVLDLLLHTQKTEAHTLLLGVKSSILVIDSAVVFPKLKNKSRSSPRRKIQMDWYIP